MLIYFRHRGKEVEREGGKHPCERDWLPLGHQTHDLSVYGTTFQPGEPHRPGLQLVFLDLHICFCMLVPLTSFSFSSGKKNLGTFCHASDEMTTSSLCLGLQIWALPASLSSLKAVGTSRVSLVQIEVSVSTESPTSFLIKHLYFLFQLCREVSLNEKNQDWNTHISLATFCQTRIQTLKKKL